MKALLMIPLKCCVYDRLVTYLAQIVTPSNSGLSKPVGYSSGQYNLVP